MTVDKNDKIGWIKRVQDHLKGFPKRLRKWWRSDAGVVCQVVVVCLAVAAAAVCWWWQDIWASIGNSSDEKVSNSETLRNLALIGAALGGLFIGIPLALWRNFVATRQVETSERNLRNERYQTGANMLGSDTLATRLGGIYALEHLAKDHPDEYHIQIMKLLCVFVRHPRTDKSFDAEAPIRPDVEAAVQAIGTRGEDGKKLESDERWHLDLRGANLKGAYLIGTDLTGAKLEYANLQGAKLDDANLTGADMYLANLTGAIMYLANLASAYMGNATLTGAKLKYANLTGAIMYRANLTDTDISHANLTDARISRANLAGATICGTTLTGADMSDVDISGTRLNQVGGLTQESLNMARALKDSPPKISASTCAKTDEPLTWTGGAGEPLTSVASGAPE